MGMFTSYKKSYKNWFFSAFLALSMVLSADAFAGPDSNYREANEAKYNEYNSRYGTTGVRRPSPQRNGSNSRSILEYNFNTNGGDVLGCGGLDLKNLVDFNLNATDLPQKFGDYLKSEFTVEMLARAMTHPLLANVFESADNFGSLRADYLTKQCNASTVNARANEIRGEALELCIQERVGTNASAEDREVATAKCLENPRFQQEAFERNRRDLPPETRIASVQRMIREKMQCAMRQAECDAMHVTTMFMKETAAGGEHGDSAIEPADIQEAVNLAAEKVAQGEELGASGGDDGEPGPGIISGAYYVGSNMTKARTSMLHQKAMRIMNEMPPKDEAHAPFAAKQQVAFLKPSSDPFLADVKLNIVSFAQSGEPGDAQENLTAQGKMILEADDPFVRFMGCVNRDYTVSFDRYYTALEEAVKLSANSNDQKEAEEIEEISRMLRSVVANLEKMRNGALIDKTRLSALIQPEANGESPYQSNVYQKMAQEGVPALKSMIGTAMGCIFNDRLAMDPSIFFRMAGSGVSQREGEAVWAAATNEVSFQVTEIILRFMKHQMLNLYASMAYDVAVYSEDGNSQVTEVGGGMGQPTGTGEEDSALTPEERASNNLNTATDAEPDEEVTVQDIQFLLESVKITSEMFENQIAALRTAHEARSNFAVIMRAVDERLNQISRPRN